MKVGKNVIFRIILLLLETLPFLLLSTVAEHVVVTESLKLKVLFGSNLQLAYSRARLTVH